MKKVFSIILSATMLFLLSTSAFAAEFKFSEPPQRASFNEYETLKQLSVQSPQALAAAGYSSREVEQIVNYKETYKNHINSLNTLPDSVLISHGYTTQQIDTIRNFDGSEAQIASLGAELTIYSTTTNFTYDGDRTRGRLAYNWYWTGVPVVKMRDMVGATWNDWWVESDTSYVSYYGVNTGSFLRTEECIYEDPQGQPSTAGAGHKFDMTRNDNAYFAKNGGGTFDLKSDDNSRKDLSYYLEYGHATISYNIGLGVCVPGGLVGSVNFTVATTRAGYDKDYFIWP